MSERDWFKFKSAQVAFSNKVGPTPVEINNKMKRYLDVYFAI